MPYNMFPFSAPTYRIAQFLHSSDEIFQLQEQLRFNYIHFTHNLLSQNTCTNVHALDEKMNLLRFASRANVS